MGRYPALLKQVFHTFADRYVALRELKQRAVEDIAHGPSLAPISLREWGTGMWETTSMPAMRPAQALDIHLQCRLGTLAVYRIVLYAEC